MLGEPEEIKRSNSRFQVARVDTREEQLRENNEGNDASKNRRKSEDFTKCSPKKRSAAELSNIETSLADSGSDGRPGTSQGPESPSATFSLNGDSIPSRTWSSVEGYNKTNCVMNTIEALPCVDHYRNVFSATGAGNIRARPTLAELHEEMVGLQQ